MLDVYRITAHNKHLFVLESKILMRWRTGSIPNQGTRLGSTEANGILADYSYGGERLEKYRHLFDAAYKIYLEEKDIIPLKSIYFFLKSKKLIFNLN